MATKKLVHPILSMSTFAVTTPNDENKNNYQPPKKNDDGSEVQKIAAKETAVKQELDSIANMSTTHVTKAKDEKKSTATSARRSSRQKRPVVYNYFVDDEDEDAGSDKKNRRRKQGGEKLNIDLTDVAMQQPILKHGGKTDGSSSKYLGVTWDKSTNKWRAQIRINGTTRHIGVYDNEEDAAADYARAVFKHKGKSDGIERLKSEQRSKASQEKIDLTGVPKQQLIMRPSGKGSFTSKSKYKGVSFDKSKNKWKAQITIDGKSRHVGSYDNEEDAAADYARAVFKVKGGNAEGKR